MGRYVTGAIVDFAFIDVPAALVSAARITSRAVWAREGSIEVLAFNQVLHRERILVVLIDVGPYTSDRARLEALSEGSTRSKKT